MGRPRGIWIAFLALWAACLLFSGGIRPGWVIPAATMAVAALTIAAIFLLPERLRLSRAAILFLAALGALYALQFLPLGPVLFPHNDAWRQAHGVGSLWPGTADAYLTLRSLAMVASYALAALLVLRLRRAGLPSKELLLGMTILLLLQAVWGCIDWILQGGSASGTFYHRNSFAGAMGIGLVLAAALASARRNLLAAWPWALAAAVFVTAIVVSKSRGGAISAAAGILLLPFFLRGRARWAGAVGLVAVAAAAFIVSHPEPLLERFDEMDLRSDERWNLAVTTTEAATLQPALGFGMGTHLRAYHPFQPLSIDRQIDHAHNEYVNLLFEGGAIGLILMLAGLGVWYVRTARGMAPPDRIGPAAALAAVSVTVVHSFVDFDLQTPALGMAFGALVGLGASAVRGAPERSRGTLFAAAGTALAAGAAMLLLPLGSLGFSPYDARACWERGREAQAGGDLETADGWYERAADLFPARADLQRETGLWFWGGWIELGEQSHLDRAARCLGRYFERHPEKIEDVMSLIWEPQRPIGEYKALIPESPLARAAFAGSLTARGRWKRAMEIFEQGCPATEEHAKAYDAFADRLRAAGQWGMEAAVRDRRLAARSDAQAYAASAQAWMRLGAPREAAKRLETSVRIDPENASWHARLAEARRAGGERAGALESYMEAVRLDPSYRAHRAAFYDELGMPEEAARDREALQNRRN